MPVTEYYCDPSIVNAGGTGSGTKVSPWGKTVGLHQYCIDQIVAGAGQGTEGDRINIKSSGEIDCNNLGPDYTSYGTVTMHQPIIWQGYTTDEGDGGRGAINFGTDGWGDATIDGMNGIDLDIRGSYTGGPLWNNDRDAVLCRCTFDLEDTAHQAWRVGFRCQCIGNYCHSIVGNSGIVAEGGTCAFNNVIDARGGSGTGIGFTMGTGMTVGNIVLMNSSMDNGIYGSYDGATIIGNRIYGTGTVGQRGIYAPCMATVLNNYVENVDIAYYSINTNNFSGMWFGNKYYNVTTPSSFAATICLEDITAATASMFEDAAGGDFNLTQEALNIGEPPDFLGLTNHKTYHSVGGWMPEEQPVAASTLAEVSTQTDAYSFAPTLSITAGTTGGTWSTVIKRASDDSSVTVTNSTTTTPTATLNVANAGNGDSFRCESTYTIGQYSDTYVSIVNVAGAGVASYIPHMRIIQ